METKSSEKKARIINLPHFFWHFLQQAVTKWYIFLIVILAGTFLGAGYAAVKNANMEKAQNTGTEISVSEERFASIQDAAEIYDLLEEQEEYNEKSILMKCGNLTFSQAVDLYQINTGDEYTDHQIAVIYMNLFDKNELYQTIAETMEDDLESKYIKEVFETQDLGGGLFKVKAASFSEEHAARMLDAAEKFLEEQKKEIEKTAKNEYTIELLNRSCAEDISDTLREKKKSAKSALTTLQTNYEGALGELSENEQKYFYLYLDEREKEDYTDGEPLVLADTPETQSGLAKKRLMIDTCLGFVLGVGLVCAYFIFRYCYSARLMNGEELAGMYRIPVLGCLAEEKKRKGVGFWFLKKQKKRFPLKEPAAEGKEIMTRLQLRFSGEDEICLLSSYGEESFEKLLIEEGKKQGLSIVQGGNILNGSFDLTKLRKSEQILLVEKEGVSKYQDIDKEIQIMREAGKEICGVVIVI